MNSQNLKKERIAIVGSGQIGRNWAMLFSTANYKINLYDIDPNQITEAKYDIKAQLEDLEKRKMLRGNRGARELNSTVGVSHCLAECVKNVSYVLDCITENLSKKKKLFSELEKFIEDRVIVSSATSSFLPSELFPDVTHKRRFLVAHPINPAYSMPLVEIVPGNWTDQQTLDKTIELFKELGQCPIVLKKECIGYASNRLQFALLAECWQLLNDGIIGLEDIDKVVTEGVAMKYAVIGPFADIHLSADGISDYLDKYRKSLISLSETYTPTPKFEGDLVDAIIEHYNKKMPLSDLSNHRVQRNLSLIELRNLKNSSEERKRSKKKNTSVTEKKNH